MKGLYLDCETVPLAASLAAAYPHAQRNPPANYKKEDTIAAWRVDDELAWRAGLVKACSVNPRLGRIFCVSSRTASTDTMQTFVARTESEEPAPLRALWARLDEQNYRAITWNGLFDLRFLCVRSLAHAIEIPPVASTYARDWFKRYGSERHVDVKALLQVDAMSSDGLSEWAAFLGIDEGTAGFSGKDVYPAFCDGQHDTIMQYCEREVNALVAVHAKVSTIFGE